MKKVFISHSSVDKKYVGLFIRLLEGMEIPPMNIFCSSFEGYGIPLGENFLETLREELKEEVFVIFLLSNNFYSSPVCLCEMGAAWIKTGIHIPVLIPPFDFADIKGVFSTVQGMSINDRAKLNSLYNQVRRFFNIIEFDINRWERRRDMFLDDIGKLIYGTQCVHLNTADTASTVLKRNIEYQEMVRHSNEKSDIMGFCDAHGEGTDVLQVSQEELGRFKYIMDALKEKLSKLPLIVRKVLYCYCSEKEYILNNSDDPKEFDTILEAVEDEFLLLEGRVVTVNIKDPKIRKVIEVLSNLRIFLNGAGPEFHNYFESTYEICAKFESRKFWSTMGML